MFSYTAIFVACIVAAVIIPWAYRLLTTTSNKLRQQVIPKPDRGPTGHLKLQPSNTSRQRAVAQWQLRKRDLMVDAHNSKPKTTHNDSGDKLYYGPINNFNASLSANSQPARGQWVERRYIATAAGTSYKMNARARKVDRFPKIFRKQQPVENPPTHGS